MKRAFVSLWLILALVPQVAFAADLLVLECSVVHLKSRDTGTATMAFDTQKKTLESWHIEGIGGRAFIIGDTTITQFDDRIIKIDDPVRGSTFTIDRVTGELIVYSYHHNEQWLDGTCRKTASGPRF